MNFEKQLYEKEGLKIDKDRILTYSQLSCPLDCKYCFVEDMNFNQKKDVTYLSEKQIKLIEKLPNKISTIMLGCDTEFFQSKEKSLEILEKLSKTNKDISVITKLSLSKEFIEKIRKIDKRLSQHNNSISFSISISCLNSVEKWEPKTPSPAKRIETLKNAYQAELKTLVAIRPLLPSVSEDELREIISSTKDYCYGYYSGPLYLKNLDILENDNMEEFDIEKIQPHWMPDDNIFYKIEKNGQMKKLREILKDNDRLLFEGAADGIKHLKKL